MECSCCFYKCIKYKRCSARDRLLLKLNVILGLCTDGQKEIGRRWDGVEGVVMDNLSEGDWAEMGWG